MQSEINELKKKGYLEVFEETISKLPEIMECYLMTGDFDYLIRVAVPDLASYQIFLDLFCFCDYYLYSHNKFSFSGSGDVDRGLDSLTAPTYVRGN